MMRMLGTGVYMKVTIELVSKAILGEHASNGVFENALGVASKNLLGCGLTLTTGVAGVTLINLVGHLFAGEDNLLGIDDDDIVAAVDVRGEARFGLATKDVGNTGSQTSNGLILGVNEHPFLLDGILVGGDCFVT